MLELMSILKLKIRLWFEVLWPSLLAPVSALSPSTAGLYTLSTNSEGNVLYMLHVNILCIDRYFFIYNIYNMVL